MPGRDSLLNVELVLKKKEMTLSELCGAHPGLVLTVRESPSAATTLMSAGRSLWTRRDGQENTESALAHRSLCCLSPAKGFASATSSTEALGAWA